MAQPWNINIHYDGKLDQSVPEHASSVLEVGCGDGFLAARLSRRVPRVVAVDVDESVLQRAKQRFTDATVTWRRGDILDLADELGEFDAVVSNATLHHLPNIPGRWAHSYSAASRSECAASGNTARLRCGRPATPSPSCVAMSGLNYPVQRCHCLRWAASS